MPTTLRRSVDSSASEYEDEYEDEEESESEDDAVLRDLTVFFQEPEEKELDGEYALEKKDAKHRNADFLNKLNNHYEALKPKPNLPFFSWVDALSVKTFKDILEPAFKHLKA